MPKPETPRPRAADAVAQGSDAARAPADPTGSLVGQGAGAVQEHSATSSAASDATPAGFEQAMAELETIVARMESGELTLEQSLAAYKRGAALLHYCQLALKDAQQQVKVLESGVLRDFPGATDDGQ
jgi:exodeoxyribonuclease VII small subunit